ncbi:hypothetical protein [Fumia xinanensis]|uniref:Uncharacterized protein n=1 Tax=Fumia xinanensis TaxID=2763659 RepID=A0A926E0I8_9FIRM|nr:hypothetical protein [Fumia xinanensis]MBC8558702.1 hypothetical protein [Fumia xinanensis]
METKTRKPINKKMIFGGVVLIFAVIGLIASIIFAANFIGNIASGSKEKEEMAWFISPVVMQDPPPFESPDKATNTTIITAGVWRFIMTQDTSKYPIDEFNFITVPQSDIEVQIKQLFGDVQYTHETVGDTELMITYNSETKSYIFPATPHVLPYTPKVEEVKKVEDSYLLTVGYIPPGLAWQGDVTGKKYEPEPEKIMQYTLKENDKGEYQIYAVANAVTDGPSNTEPDNDVSNLEPGNDNAPDASGISSDETSDGPESVSEDSQQSTPESSETA